MSTRPMILPPSSLGESFAPLVTLNDGQFRSLVQLLRGPRGYQPKKSDIDALKQLIPPTQVELSFLLPALGYLHNRVSELADEGADRKPAIAEVTTVVAEELKGASIEFDESLLKSRLSTLLEEPEEQKTYQKMRRLSAGFLPSAIGFSTLVDLRPDFTEDEDPEIRAYLPVIQFRVRTDSQTPGLKNFVFQVDRDLLVELKKVVVRAEKKLNALQNLAPLKGKVLET